MKKMLLTNGKVVMVTANVAHGLIESGEGVPYQEKKKKYKKTAKRKYKNKMMTSEE